MTILNFDVEEALSSMRERGFYVAHNALDKLTLSDLQTAFNIYMNSGPTSGAEFGISELESGIHWVDHPLTINSSVIRIALNELLLSLSSSYLNQPSTFSYSFAYRSLPIPGMSGDVQAKTIPEGVFKGWHSDANLSCPTRGYRCLVAMLYLTDVNEGDGGVWIVDKSHSFGGLKRAWTPKEFEQYDSFEVTAKAGSLVIFDMEMIHRAGTPTGEKSRDIIRFMYAPSGGYTQHMLIPMHYIPKDLTPSQIKAANFDSYAHDSLRLSKNNDRKKWDEKPVESLAYRIKRRIRNYILNHI